MKYKYVGDGTGVPGLPHEISDDEAEAWGVTELLKAAVENGSYVEVPSQALPTGEEPDIVSDLTDTGTSPKGEASQRKRKE